MNKVFGFGCALSVVLLALSLQAGNGSHWKKADSMDVGKTKTVTLVDEVDDDGDPSGSGGYYIKISCKRSVGGYTVYTTGVDDESGIDMSVDDESCWEDYGDKDGPDLPGFEGSTDADGNIRYILYAEDWEYCDDSSGDYYIYLSGEIGDTVTVTFIKGEVEEPIPYGTEDHPLRISPSGSYKKNMIGTDFFFVTTLKAGNRYKFWTAGGSADEDIWLDVSAYGDEVEEPDLREMSGLEEGNAGLIVTAVSDGDHLIKVSGGISQPFTLSCDSIGARTPANHPNVTDAGALTEEGYADAACEPGHRNDPNSGFYDPVIDQKLYKVKLAKDAWYAFETEGAKTNLVLEVYDAKGAVLVSNRGTTTSAFDCRIGFNCTKAGDYWVGVCEDLADDEADKPSGETVVFTARLVQPADIPHDIWDYGDDVLTGANGLAPGMGEFTSHGPHTLGLVDQVDIFRIDARQGLTYTVRSVLDEGASERMKGFTLRGTLYKIVNGKRSTAKNDTIDIDDLSKGYSFLSEGNGSWGLEVRVADAEGSDYGPYALESKADGEGGIGALSVEIWGATFAEGATWSLTTDKKPVPLYAGGGTIHLAPGSYEVTFSSVSGWTKPANATVNVVDRQVASVVAKYSDTCDVIGNDATLGDGSKTGKKVTDLKTYFDSAKNIISRSLWSDDEADWFKFTTAANTYYTFVLEESQKLGDAEITVYRENGTDVVARGRDVTFACREPKSTYYVAVTHTTAERIDSQYVMRCTTKEVGGISFAKNSTAVKVKADATSVTLTVNRDTKAAAGRVRVRYSTFAGTADPGRNYQPQSGYLEWAAGDKKAKTIVIELIPDLVSHWAPDCQFTVQLATVAIQDVAADECLPLLAAPSTATVTIEKSKVKKNAGTVSPVGAGVGVEPFADAKKPSAAVSAGEGVTLWYERTGGSDGEAAIVLTPTKGTAAPDVNYDPAPQTLVWADGEAGAKSAVFQTLVADEAYQAAKAFTVKAAADKTVSKDVKVANTAVTVTVRDPKVSKTVGEYAAEVKPTGIDAKEAKADTWYFDEVGELTGVTPAAGASATLTLTLTGAGRFVCRPLFDNGGNEANVCKITIGKKTVELKSGVDAEIREYIATKKPTDKTTVTIALTRDRKDESEGPRLTFADLGDGAPFVWTVLPTPTLVAPLAGAVVVADECDETITFRWTTGEAGDVLYLFTLNKNKSNLGKKDDKFTAMEIGGGAFPVRVYCADCQREEQPQQLASGATYYWRVDTTFAAEDCTVTNVNPSVWTVTALDCESVRPVVAGGVDAEGRPIVPSGENTDDAYDIRLVQAVATGISFGAANQTPGSTLSFAVAKGSSLPKGLTLKDGRLTGAPSKPGTYQTVVQVSETVKVGNKKTTKAGGTLTLNFEVEPINLAAGTFNGIVQALDEAFAYDADGYVTGGALALRGSLAVTAKDDGKISATATIGGTKYAFATTGWSGTLTLDNGQPGVFASMTNVAKLTMAKVGRDPARTVNVTNVLELTACRGTSTDNGEALDTPLEAMLTVSFLDGSKTNVWEDIEYFGQAYRDNRKEAENAERLAPFVGYYTIALAPKDYEQALRGYGYLTMTVDAKGGAKMSGVLADGTTVSKAVVGEIADVKAEGSAGRPEFRVPVLVSAKTTLLAGELVIALGEGDVPFVSADSELQWINTNAAATYEGLYGFSILIEPVGGFYNTLYNLQAYYLHYDFRVADQEQDLEEVSEALLDGDTDERLVCWPGLYGEYVDVVGNALNLPKQVKVMREAKSGTKTVKLIDWEKTVNPANISMAFKQATGVFSGSFEIWKGSNFDDDDLETKQTKLGPYKYQGVLLQARDFGSGELAFEDGVMAGFSLLPLKLPIEGKKTTRAFTASLPFVVVPEEKSYDWEDSDWQEALPVGGEDDFEED